MQYKYANPVYERPARHAGLTKDESDRLEMIQKRAVKLKLGHNYSTYDDTQLKLTKQLNLNSLDSRRHELTYHFGLNCLNSPANRGLIPEQETPY